MKDSQQKIPQVRSRTELLCIQHSMMTPSRDSMACGTQIRADALHEGKDNAWVRAETDSADRRVMCGRFKPCEQRSLISNTARRTGSCCEGSLMLCRGARVTGETWNERLLGE